MTSQIQLQPPARPEPIMLRRDTARIEIHASEDRNYPDLVTIYAYAATNTTSKRRENVRCRPNYEALDRYLTAAGVPSEMIAATTRQVLAMLSEQDAAWRTYATAAAVAERTSPITISIASTTGGATWDVLASYDVTGQPTPRRRDEGGSHPSYRLARMEADDLATRYTRQHHTVTRAYVESVDVAALQTQRSIDAVLKYR